MLASKKVERLQQTYTQAKVGQKDSGNIDAAQTEHSCTDCAQILLSSLHGSEHAVMKRSRTVNAHGLIPSTVAATITVGKVIFGRYICMASAGALGCHKPVSATAPKATTANVDRVIIRRRGEVVTMLSFDNQLTIHRRIRPYTTANIAVIGVCARLIGRKGNVIRAFGRSDDIHP